MLVRAGTPCMHTHTIPSHHKTQHIRATSSDKPQDVSFGTVHYWDMDLLQGETNGHNMCLPSQDMQQRPRKSETSGIIVIFSWLLCMILQQPQFGEVPLDC